MRNTLSAVLTLLATAGLANIAYGGDDDGDGGHALRFRATPTGAQEVTAPPGVVTDTKGRFRINFNKGLSEADFRLIVRDGTEITQAHIHCGRAGTNGPVVAFLFGFVAGGVDVDGKLSAGTLTNDDLTGADCVPYIGSPVNNIASLGFAARDGLTYVNVHSVANPAGEVRGQLLER